ncbi:hypothetical protein E8E11_011205 [Didymella keratinophila]|nr:hypothetical protein E8E11_011205 [Didymella keratinophila]
MPLYDIEYVIPLTDAQQEALAKAFTSIHCARFHTPSFFINVRFTDVSTQKVYRGGVLRYYNRAILRTRVSENRTREQYGEHCKELIAAWDRIAGPEDVDSKHDKTLRTVWIMGALTTAVEMGFQRPAAGEEIEWLRSNKDDFKRLAGHGDEDMQQMMEELRSRKDFAGSLARIGPNELVTSDPEVLRKIMSVRSAWYDAWKLEAGKDNLFCMRDEAAHMKLRNTMSAGVVDLAQKLRYFTLNVISNLAFGKPLGYLQHDPDPYNYVEAMDASMPVLAFLGNIPWLAILFHSPFLRRFLPSEKDKGGFGAVIGSLLEQVLLQLNLKTVMLCLMTNPAAYERVQAEIEDGVSKGTISAPSKDSEARQLTYLQAVIKEGFRVKSPAGGAFYKMVPPGGDMINGLFIPGMTQVGVSHLSFLHSEEVFGPDAQMFRPERWLDPETDPGYMSKMNSTLDMMFHSGKYQCLGKSVALMEFNKIFIELLRTFDFSIINTEKPVVSQMQEALPPFSGTPTVQIEVIGGHNGSASIRRTNTSDNGTSDEKKGDVPADDVKELMNLVGALRGFPSSDKKDIYGADVKVDFNTMKIQWSNGDDDSVGVNEIAGEQKDEFKRVADSIEALARTFAKKDSAV